MNIRIAGTVGDSIVDGPGLRLTVFTQGCPHRCPGCHNPETHDPAGGHDADTGEILAALARNPLASGVTLSGGEPFCQPQPLAELARLVHSLGKDVTAYSGWTYEQLVEQHDPAVDDLLAQVDVLIDGPFLLEQRNLELTFRGSENQRLIDMNKTRQQGRVVLLEL